jgi:anti-sigma-K factor RskA
VSDIIQMMIEPHHEAEELLPWYVTGQLDFEEQARVEQHVSNCAHCRRQLAFERRMIDEFSTMTPEVDSGWARLRRRIEQPRETWWHKVERDFAAVWKGFNRPPIAAFAVAQLAFVVIAGAMLLSLSQPSYRALGSAPPPQTANMIVMFGADTSELQMTKLLRANGMTLVGGPTSTAAYLVRVPASSRSAVLARLRSDRHVILAQPIDGERP